MTNTQYVKSNSNSFIQTVTYEVKEKKTCTSSKSDLKSSWKIEADGCCGLSSQVKFEQNGKLSGETSLDAGHWNDNLKGVSLTHTFEGKNGAKANTMTGELELAYENDQCNAKISHATTKPKEVEMSTSGRL